MPDTEVPTTAEISSDPTALSTILALVDADVPDAMKPAVHDAVALVLKAESKQAMTIGDLSTVLSDVQPLVPDTWAAVGAAVPAAVVAVLTAAKLCADQPVVVQALVMIAVGFAALMHVKSQVLRDPPMRVATPAKQVTK